jgi:hypothetical protein
MTEFFGAERIRCPQARGDASSGPGCWRLLKMRTAQSFSMPVPMPMSTVVLVGIVTG